MDRFVVKRKSTGQSAKPAKLAKPASESIGYARCPICDVKVGLSVMGQHVDSGCKEFAGAKRRKSDDATVTAVPHAELGGQYIVEDFLSVDEEEEILALLDDADADPPWAACRFNGQHRGKHWGVRIDIAAGKLMEQTHPMPEVLRAVVRKMRTVDVLRSFHPNECNAISYERATGDSLKVHCDHRGLSGDILVNLCLSGAATMTFYTGVMTHAIAATHAQHAATPPPRHRRDSHTNAQVHKGRRRERADLPRAPAAARFASPDRGRPV